MTSDRPHPNAPRCGNCGQYMELCYNKNDGSLFYCCGRYKARPDKDVHPETTWQDSV